MKNTHEFPDEMSWENKKLGASEQHVKKTNKAQEKEVDDNLGLQLISLRLQKHLIKQLKQLASAEGIGYQPLIRQVLSRYVREASDPRSNRG